MKILEGKKALVTGASRGIGKAIAAAYCAEGAHVAVTGRNMDALLPVLDEIRSVGGKISGFEWDVSKEEDVDERIRRIAGELGGLDIVVNNAGVVGAGRFLEVTWENWDLVMNTNLKGLFFVCQAAANYMVAQGIRGRIVNIASDAGLRGASSPYGISKWGVIGLTKGFAQELMPKGIVVTAIAPGAVTTDMMGWKPGASAELENPFGRMAYPEEIADLAVFLVSDKAARIAGDAVVINGGL